MGSLPKEAEANAHEATCTRYRSQRNRNGTATTNDGASGNKLTTSGGDNSEIGAMPLPQDMSELDMVSVDLAGIEDVERQHAITSYMYSKTANDNDHEVKAVQPTQNAPVECGNECGWNSSPG